MPAGRSIRMRQARVDTRQQSQAICLSGCQKVLHRTQMAFRSTLRHSQPLSQRVPLLGDRSFDHDNDTEREDGIHRMDAHIVADEETVKAADDPHMLDFRP